MDKKAIENMLYGWIWVPLEDVLLKITDGSHNPPERKAEGIPMLSVQNIINNHVVFEIYLD